MNKELLDKYNYLFKDKNFDKYIPIEYIIIHHSDSEDDNSENALEIKKYHTSYRINYKIVSEEEFVQKIQLGTKAIFEFPWTDVGYNYLIEKVNDKFTIFIGRSLTIPGAHTLKMNNKSIGICLIGNYDTTAPTEEQYNLIAHLCNIFTKCFEIPIENILGHREANKLNNIISQKTCPGTKFDMDYLRNKIKVIDDIELDVKLL